MSNAGIMSPGRQAPGYLASPDMAAFTIGQIAIASLREGGTFSMESLRRELVRIASGQDEAITARVNPDMALAALHFVDAALRHKAA